MLTVLLLLDVEEVVELPQLHLEHRDAILRHRLFLGRRHAPVRIVHRRCSARAQISAVFGLRRRGAVLADLLGKALPQRRGIQRGTNHKIVRKHLRLAHGSRPRSQPPVTMLPPRRQLQPSILLVMLPPTDLDNTPQVEPRYPPSSTTGPGTNHGRPPLCHARARRLPRDWDALDSVPPLPTLLSSNHPLGPGHNLPPSPLPQNFLNPRGG
jgi:hypothetical protein